LANESKLLDLGIFTFAAGEEREVMTPSNFCFRAAMLLVLAGMLWGPQMAITDDHSAISPHAHLNLLGFVPLFSVRHLLSSEPDG
jgi:hypothetical protein